MLEKCVLCQAEEESPRHLYFNCAYTSIVWGGVHGQLGAPLGARSMRIDDLLQRIKGMVRGLKI